MSSPTTPPPSAASISATVSGSPAAVGADTRWARRLVAALLVVSGLLGVAYAGISVYAATLVVANARAPIVSTPALLGLAYHDVSFPSRGDGIVLRGWLIPGILSDGTLTVQRTIIVVCGNGGNRADGTIGLLGLEVQLARHGFAVLAYDPRGQGESPDAPNSFGYFEQRDVLGAVDFLRKGDLPYPELGKPRVLAAWGVSKGGVSILLAAAQEPAIHALVLDSTYPDMAPILEREIPKGGVPAVFTPGILLADRALYGIDFYNTRPADAFARIGPRPMFFIQGDHDDFNPPSNLALLTAEASVVPGAQVQSWQVPGVTHHAQTYDTAPDEYVRRVVAFYTAALGPDTSPA